jgi:hypothetical protein
MKRKNLNKIKYVASLIIMLSFVNSVSVFADDTATTATTPSGAPLGAGRGVGRLKQGSEGGNGANENKGAGTGNAGGDICARIADMATKAEEKIGKIKTPGERFANWQEKATENDTKLATLRTQWNSNRDAQFAKLNEKATTDAQKLAVADFEKTTKTAISTRQAAVDAAIVTFRAGVKNLIVTYENGVSGDRTAFEAAIKAAFDAAKTDCQNNVSPATVRTNLKNALAAARSKFKLDKQDVPKVGSDIQSLIAARKQSMDKAFTEFKATMETARAALKKDFPADTSTTMPTPVQ